MSSKYLMWSNNNLEHFENAVCSQLDIHVVAYARSNFSPVAVQWIWRWALSLNSKFFLSRLSSSCRRASFCFGCLKICLTALRPNLVLIFIHIEWVYIHREEHWSRRHPQSLCEQIHTYLLRCSNVVVTEGSNSGLYILLLYMTRSHNLIQLAYPKEYVTVQVTGSFMDLSQNIESTQTWWIRSKQIEFWVGCDIFLFIKFGHDFADSYLGFLLQWVGERFIMFGIKLSMCLKQILSSQITILESLSAGFLTISWLCFRAFSALLCGINMWTLLSLPPLILSKPRLSHMIR